MVRFPKILEGSKSGSGLVFFILAFFGDLDFATFFIAWLIGISFSNFFDRRFDGAKIEIVYYKYKNERDFATWSQVYHEYFKHFEYFKNFEYWSVGGAEGGEGRQGGLLASQFLAIQLTLCQPVG